MLLILHMGDHALKELFAIALLQIGPFPISLKISLQIAMIPFVDTGLKVYLALLL